MNFEGRIEQFGKILINHRIKVILSTLIVIFAITFGMRFLETPSGYRGFVEEDFKYYQDVLDLEEKYGNIDVLTYVIKPNNGNIFQRNVLNLIHELTEISWQTPYSSRVSSITNHQYTTVDGDDISITDFVDDIDSMDQNKIKDLYNFAVAEDAVVNFVMSESGNVGLVNINLEMPEDINFKEPIEFAWKQKDYFENKYSDIYVGVAGSAQFSDNFQSTSESDATKMYPSFLILIIILTYILLRSVVASIISLTVILLSILPSLGAAGWLGFEVQPPLITAPIIILTISLTHAIHMLSIALTNMAEGMTKNDAIIESLKGIPVLLFIPLPWNWEGILYAIQFFESVGLIIAFIYIIKKYSLLKIQAFYPLIFSFGVAFGLYALLVQNEGSFVRYRFEIVFPWIVALYYLGVSSLSQSREANKASS